MEPKEVVEEVAEDAFECNLNILCIVKGEWRRYVGDEGVGSANQLTKKGCG